MSEEFSIGSLSERSGMNVETIRCYEKIGVMPIPARTGAGYRIYNLDDLRRLHFVRRGRELGFSLDELRGMLHLVDGHNFTCAQVQALTIEHLKGIRQKIIDLQRLERVLSDMAKQCSGDQLPECPIIDALFEMRPVINEKRRDSNPRPHN